MHKHSKELGKIELLSMGIWSISKHSIYRHQQIKHIRVKSAVIIANIKLLIRVISLNINSLNTLEYVIADQCEHKATTQSNRTKHNQSKHLGMKYSCDQCKHSTTTECSIIIHKPV